MYILPLFSSPVAWFIIEKAQGSSFFIQQGTSCNSLFPGLVPSIITKQINSCLKACTGVYYLYNCISYSPLQVVTNSQMQFNRSYAASQPLPVGFYLCNQGFQRQKASLKGSLMKRGPVCPAAWNSKSIKVNLGKQKNHKGRFWEDRGKTAACKCRSRLKSMWDQLWKW